MLDGIGIRGLALALDKWRASSLPPFFLSTGVMGCRSSESHVGSVMEITKTVV